MRPRLPSCGRLGTTSSPCSNHPDLEALGPCRGSIPRLGIAWLHRVIRWSGTRRREALATEAQMKVTLKFSIERETKGTMRYKEQVAGEFDEPVSGTLYVRKSAFKAEGRVPEVLTVTIEG